MGRKLWEQDEIELMIKLYGEGFNYVEIGTQLNRPKVSVRKKLQAMGIAKAVQRNSASLWDVESLRPYVNKEEAMKETKGSHKKISVLCPDCLFEKKIRIANLVKNGMSCSCTKGISYPELFFTAYLETKNIKYQTQVKFDDSLRRIDFYIPSLDVYVETHGEQHYNKKSQWYSNSNESDEIKRKWAKDNGYTLIELDCRESTFEYIRSSIDDCEYLESITNNEIFEITTYMQNNERYDIKDIVKLYKIEEMTANQIGEMYGVSYVTILNILKKNNVRLKNNGKAKRIVRLIETNQIFMSLVEAHKQTGVACGNLSKCINPNHSAMSVGIHPITGDALHWERVNELEMYAIKQAEARSAEVKINTDIELTQLKNEQLELDF